MLFEGAYPVEHFRQAGAGHDAVLHVVVRRDTAHRGEGRLAAGPDPRALRLGCGNLKSGCAVAPADLLHEDEQRPHLCGRTIELHDEHRVGRREAGVHCRLGGANRERVHHLDGGRNDTGANDVRDCPSPGIDGVEGRKQRLHRFRLPQDSDDDLGHDGKRSLGPHDQPEQIGSRRISKRTAELHQLAIGKHRFQAEHVMDGKAVLQAVRTAGILRDVAPDGADLLARRIGGVVVAMRSHPAGNLEIRDAWLHGDAPVWNVDVEHAVQPCE